ncbi:MAG: phosphoribosylaminoimidazolesuccinocarboxamide synthase [Candidatus Levybacteria bacterium]|nr:phosphoribosylaminoimidazolesuccinocarboxamide synthase [Candidatus Levybacteria bacterium]
MINNILSTVNLPKTFGKKHQGKVRDYYISKTQRVIITTDRQSAFDRILGFIPFKGQVLNQLSVFWFEKTKDIVQNHLISVPDPNAMIVKNCKVIPIEMVVRGYISGVTSTSIWTAYAKGERVIYGINFPEGLRKNQKLKKPIITPTTKAEVGHDERLTEEAILERKIVSKKLWRQMKRVSLALFEKGTKICAKAGIILVDTKYEFGLHPPAGGGKLMLIDEIHTPDSSRFWIKKTYKERFKKGLEPENFDKEFLRLWFKKQGYSGDGKPPKMPDEFIAKVSKRYIQIYEKITGKKFQIGPQPVADRIKRNLKTYGEIQ